MVRTVTVWVIAAVSIGGGVVSANVNAKMHYDYLIYFLWTLPAATAAIFVILYTTAHFLLPKPEKRNGVYGSAHWATEKEINESGLRSDEGIVVGATVRRNKVQLLRYGGEGHVLVVSPTRSGKGVSVVIPTALTWEHSILFNDIKGELWALTSGWRKKQFDSLCLRFDATCEDASAARWNPLFEIRPYPHDVRDAQNIAMTIAGDESSSGRENDRHWRVMGTRLLKAAILHQLYVGKDKSLPGCYKLLTNLKGTLEDTLEMMLQTAHDPGLTHGWRDELTDEPTATHPVVAHIARDMLSKSDREGSAIVSTTISYLEPFDEPIMARNISTSDFSLNDLMHNEQPVSLYLTTPVADLERVKTLHRLFFTLSGLRNTETLDFVNGLPTPKYKHRLLEVFDECAHLGYSPEIQKQFSLASGYGIQGMFVFQDYSQIFALYGRSESITSNCDVKISFGPNSMETANPLSQHLGKQTVEKESVSNFNSFSLKQQVNKDFVGRDLLTPDECLRFSQKKSIIMKNGCPPILGDKVPYFRILRFNDATKIPAPPSDRIVPIGLRWYESMAHDFPPAPVEVAPPKRRRGRPRKQKE